MEHPCGKQQTHYRPSSTSGGETDGNDGNPIATRDNAAGDNGIPPYEPSRAQGSGGSQQQQLPRSSSLSSSSVTATPGQRTSLGPETPWMDRKQRRLVSRVNNPYAKQQQGSSSYSSSNSSSSAGCRNSRTTSFRAMSSSSISPLDGAGRDVTALTHSATTGSGGSHKMFATTNDAMSALGLPSKLATPTSASTRARRATNPYIRKSRLRDNLPAPPKATRSRVEARPATTTDATSTVHDGGRGGSSSSKRHRALPVDDGRCAPLSACASVDVQGFATAHPHQPRQTSSSSPSQNLDPPTRQEVNPVVGGVVLSAREASGGSVENTPGGFLPIVDRLPSRNVTFQSAEIVSVTELRTFLRDARTALLAPRRQVRQEEQERRLSLTGGTNKDAKEMHPLEGSSAYPRCTTGGNHADTTTAFSSLLRSRSSTTWSVRVTGILLEHNVTEGYVQVGDPLDAKNRAASRGNKRGTGFAGRRVGGGRLVVPSRRASPTGVIPDGRSAPEDITGGGNDASSNTASVLPTQKRGIPRFRKTVLVKRRLVVQSSATNMETTVSSQNKSIANDSNPNTQSGTSIGAGPFKQGSSKSAVNTVPGLASLGSQGRSCQLGANDTPHVRRLNQHRLASTRNTAATASTTPRTSSSVVRVDVTTVDLRDVTAGDLVMIIGEVDLLSLLEEAEAMRCASNERDERNNSKDAVPGDENGEASSIVDISVGSSSRESCNDAGDGTSFEKSIAVRQRPPCISENEMAGRSHEQNAGVVSKPVADIALMARIARNANGTDMNLFMRAIRARRKYLRTRMEIEDVDGRDADGHETLISYRPGFGLPTLFVNT